MLRCYGSIILGVRLDEVRCPVLGVVVEVLEASTTMLELMMVIDISEAIIRHLHYRKWYLLLVVETLEMTGPVKRNLVTCPVTI